MTNLQPKKYEVKTENHWWYVESLIAGLNASPTRKYLLTLVHRHTHTRKGFAWADQKTLAHEMGVDLSTVKRAFRWGKKIGVIIVRRIRTGKGHSDQYNEYWLYIPRLKELQRTEEHPAPVTGASSEEHPEQGASLPPASEPDQGAFEALPGGKTHPDQGANPLRARGTSDLQVFEVKQVMSKAGEDKAGSSPVGSPGNTKPAAAQPAAAPRGVIETKTQELAKDLTHQLYRKMREPNPDFEGIRQCYQKEGDALGIPFKTFRQIYERSMRDAAQQNQLLKQELVDQLRDNCRLDIRESPFDENCLIGSFYWFADEAKQLGIPQDEMERLWRATTEFVVAEFSTWLGSFSALEDRNPPRSPANLNHLGLPRTTRSSSTQC